MNAVIDVPASLSSTCVALANESEKVAAKPDQVIVGTLRIRVLQAIDVPASQTAELGSSVASSWLHFSSRRLLPHLNVQQEAIPDMICVLLQTTKSGVYVTEARPWSSAIRWDEEFFMEQVTSSDELVLCCVDRARNDSNAVLSLPGEVTANRGFIGKVTLPLARLPEGQEVEQWYPLVWKELSPTLRTALRVSLCFDPNGVPAAVVQSFEKRRGTPTSMLPLSSATETLPASPVSIPANTAAISLESGVIDYVLVVGAAEDTSNCTTVDEAYLRFRYPVTDRPSFPLPTKIEWFCFPGGPEVIIQPDRPQSKLFSFVLVGGDDGLCRSYVVCLVVYHRRLTGESEEKKWHGICLAFVTRIPLIKEISTCLFAVAHAWMAVNRRKKNKENTDVSRLGDTQKQLFRLCHEIALPIRGVFGVQFAVDNLRIRLVVPSMTSIYTTKEGVRPEVRRIASAQGGQASPTTRARSFIAIQQGFQPIVYSLEPLFQLFDIKSIIYLVTLVLCEYRILIHSTQQSILCPVAEGLCALMYPFHWQHPYVPILPRVLSEYFQAPLPYILGIHTCWLRSLIENGRPEHLVVVDIDRGTIQLQETGGPILPDKLTSALRQRLKVILHPSLYRERESSRRSSIGEEVIALDEILEDLNRDVQNEQRSIVEWDSDTERKVRMEFVCFFSALVQGYRECLFFVNQKLPVFNKRRFFESESTDNEVVPLVTRLFCTQAFQSFLESHSSAELSVFHYVYLTLCREPKDFQWSHPTRALSLLKGQHLFLDTKPVRTDIPILVNDDSRFSNDSNDGYIGESQDSVQPTNATGDKTNYDGHKTLETLGRTIEKLLDEESSVPWDPFAIDTSDIEALTADMSRSIGRLTHEVLGQKLGVDPNLLMANAHLLQNAHRVNQYRLHLDSAVAAALANPSCPGGRYLSSDDEQIEQVLQKCLAAVFTSDDTLTEAEIRACEAHFKSAHARELFVLILMQPSNQYVESVSGSPKANGTRTSSAWYNPKGSGSYIGAAGFQLLARLTSALLKQCAVQEDYSTARGILQVAHHYYHYVEDKHSGIGFGTLLITKKEYLVAPLRLLPICRSLDLWQHAFICEIDDMNLADPTGSDEEILETVGDEVFFSVIGSLMYDMLNFEVPLQKVQTFVNVMCSTYQKEKHLLDTLKQLAVNVYRALDMSKDIKPSPPKGAFESRISARAVNKATLTPALKPKLPSVTDISTERNTFAESPMLSREYDLNTVIRRKILVRETPSVVQAKKGYVNDDCKSVNNQQASDWRSMTPSTRRRKSSAVYPSAVLASTSSPVLCLATNDFRAACGMANARVNVVDIDPSEEQKGIRLDGHSDAVVAIQMRGNALISGSRDHTLRAWDLRATPKKRSMFAFFSVLSNTSNFLSLTENSEIDGASVSKRSLVMRGHFAAITCMELGHQLGAGRSLLASGSDDGTARLWETTKESSVALLSDHKVISKPVDNGGVSCLRLLTSDDDLAIGYRCRTVQIWDLAVSKLKISVEAHRAGVRDLQVSGNRLVTAANDRVVKIWDTSFRGNGGTLQATQELRGHGGPVQCVSLGGPVDPTICTGAADGLVRVWDLRYVQRGPRLVLRGHTGPVTRLQRDFTKLVSGGEDGWLRVWDMHSGSCLREKQAHSSGLSCLEMHDSLVYSGSWDGSVRVWDIENVNNTDQAAV